MAPALRNEQFETQLNTVSKSLTEPGPWSFEWFEVELDYDNTVYVR